MRSLLRCSLAGLAVLALSCSADLPSGGPGAPGGGSATQPPATGDPATPPSDPGAPPTSPPGSAPGPVAPGGPDDGPSCTATGYPVAATPPNVLIVLDRSCSMRRRIDRPDSFATGPEDSRGRWYHAREAIRRLTERFPGQVRWGLMMFPTVGGCAVESEAQVEPGPLSGTRVMEALESPAAPPFDGCNGGAQEGGTPTEEALDAALALPSMHDPARASYVVVVTDGAANCGATAESLTVATTRLAAAEIETAVVGFSAEASSGGAPALLDAIAEFGGMPRAAAAPYYYTADDGDALESVLAAIAAEAIDCTLRLDGTPPDADRLFVALDGAELPRGEPDGWTYDATSATVSLLGASCDRLRGGDVTRVDVAWGCRPTGAGSAVPCTPSVESCDGLDNDCNGVVDNDCLI